MLDKLPLMLQSKKTTGLSMKALFGPILRVNFHDEETGHSILRVKLSDRDGTRFVSVKGPMFGAPESVGKFIKAVGDYNDDGDFLAAAVYPPTIEKANAPLLPFFESKQFPGITPFVARALEEKYGSEWEMTLLKDADAIANLDIPDSAKQRAKATWRSAALRLRPYFILSNLGMSFKQAMSTIDALGTHAELQFMRNPYILKMINGVGIAKADTIANTIGVKQESAERLRHLVLDAMEKSEASGNTIVTLGKLKNMVSKHQEISEDQLKQFIKSDPSTQLKAFKLPGVGDFIAKPSAVQLTKGIADRLYELKDKGPVLKGTMPKPISNFDLDPEQEHAIETCTRSPVSILTGGPGTGKTTIIREVAHAIREFNSGERILYGALAGKAARRLQDSTGEPASTVHNMLGMRPGSPPKYDSKNRLPCDTLILDEGSMVDEAMFSDLLKALPDGARLILVGDVNQLPSISPGSVLRDLVRSNAFPTVRLKKSNRFANGSGIAMVADSILKKKLPDLTPSDEFNWIDASNPASIGNEIIESVKRAINKGVDVKDIQCLTPQHGTAIGSEVLNKRLKPLLNPGFKDKPSIARFGQEFHVGDRLIQTASDYGLNIFNGDIGHIEYIDYRGQTNEGVPCIDLKLDDADERGTIKIPLEKINKLRLAYSKSIHKSQGSEYPFVVFPVSGLHRNMIDQQILFTGATRCRSELCVVGERSVFQAGVRNVRSQKRETLLTEAVAKTFGIYQGHHKEKRPASEPAVG